MEVRKKRPGGFKKEAQGVQVSPLNPLSVSPCKAYRSKARPRRAVGAAPKNDALLAASTAALALSPVVTDLGSGQSAETWVASSSSSVARGAIVIQNGMRF
jgi:hypothetical protein